MIGPVIVTAEDLPHSDQKERIPMNSAVPTIDIGLFIDGSRREKIVADVRDACRNTGFLVITGHGIDPEIVSGAVEASKTFFDRPVPEKEHYRNPARRTGYAEFANMSLGQSQGDDVPPDLREGYTMRRVDIIDWRSPVWGNSEPDIALRTAMSAYYTAMDSLADTIMSVFALALELPENWFSSRFDRHDSQLAIYHYPPMDRPPLPGQLRGGAHTDFGSLTLLSGSPSVRGLQIWDGEKWEDAPLIPGSLVVNIGDLMQRWTNDSWHSTLHRVVNPVDGEWDKARYTIAFFHQPNHDSVISSLDAAAPAKYAEITSGEHFTSKLEAMALTK
ncbi:isopenicillin N synthase family dioxygenase [Subtercola endophyticus]|uniref:isopenicillin N synthase family dioxygenase n=1 Tax=Subtercola endophyticus TaxID=2895559 RepID=UPI001E29693D|nr:2OG-Fe(II) oxygenase family protein [Subtercola endophyticus]UFS60609.1 hypothetical protein LQ955_07675 [Subtercola endophyticus]